MGGIENAVHGGRGLRTWHGQNAGEDEAGWPQVAYESIRAINHLTSQGYAVPAPVLYDVLGDGGRGWRSPWRSTTSTTPRGSPQRASTSPAGTC